VVETRKLALFESQGNSGRYRDFIRQAHAERLNKEYGMPMRRSPTLTRGLTEIFPDLSDPAALNRLQASLQAQAGGRINDNPGKVHQLLANYPLVKIEHVYRYVFERILGEQISTVPVVQN
jgi:hypothetical protein